MSDAALFRRRRRLVMRFDHPAECSRCAPRTEPEHRDRRPVRQPFSLQPPSRPELIPETPYTRSRQGALEYEGSYAAAEPSGPRTMRWTLRWRVFHGQRLLAEHIGQQNGWWTISDEDVSEEAESAGLMCTPGAEGLIVLRRAVSAGPAAHAQAGRVDIGQLAGKDRRRAGDEPGYERHFGCTQWSAVASCTSRTSRAIEMALATEATCLETPMQRRSARHATDAHSLTNQLTSGVGVVEALEA
jgi:hypothetical protein